MPQVRAFRGIRYDLAHVGSLSDVVAPPYDVIGPDFQERLYKRHPCNVVRLILNREEPGDGDENNRYTRAARFLRNWMHEGVLMVESDPALYVYDQVFEHAGQQYTRRGVMARVKLERFGEGTIYPHEETYAGPKADRLKLMQATRANLSQVFGIVPDASSELSSALTKAVEGRPPLEAADDLGVVHRMWVVTEIDYLQAIQRCLASEPTFIADGHHRYETACHYRDLLAEQEGGLDPEHPANYGLMMVVGMSDPGMIVLPTHRVLRGIPAWSSDQLCARLSSAFEVSVTGDGPEAGGSIWNEIESAGDQHRMAFYAPADRRWVTAELTPDGASQMAELASSRTAEWRGLGVAILHQLVLDHLLKLQDAPRPDYLHDVKEVVDLIDSNSQPPVGLAALVMPATLDDIRVLSLQGERMPQKSTYFYPKLLSGLVINPLE